MNYLHSLSKIIATASNNGVFLSLIIVFILMALVDFAFKVTEKVFFDRNFLHVFDILNVVFWIVIYVLVLSKIGAANQ